MYPEDRVLVGVITRPIDLDHARDHHWYRIPQARYTRGIHAEYLAFFLGGSFGEKRGGIHYYARRTGHELVRRRDLLPEETDNPRADNLYYKIQLGELREKIPPVLNPSRRTVAFIHTTWDRFVAATEISELYSTADHFVDRVYYALRNAGVPAERFWEADQLTDDGGAQLHVSCERGAVIATTGRPAEDRLFLPAAQGPEAIQQVIVDVRKRIEALGGLLSVPVPLEQ